MKYSYIIKPLLWQWYVLKNADLHSQHETYLQTYILTFFVKDKYNFLKCDELTLILLAMNIRKLINKFRLISNLLTNITSKNFTFARLSQ